MGKILKWMAGRRPGERENVNIFTNLNLSAFVILIAKILGFNSPVDFSAFASSVVTNRNNVLHVWSIDGLEKDIVNVTLGIELFPSLKKDANKECLVVRKYDMLKESVPTLFK